MSKLILASGSPRRRELLGQMGFAFTVCKSTCEEVITKTEPSEVVCELSGQKAEEVFLKVAGRDLPEFAEVVSANDDFLVIGADTIVAFDGRILGKPKNEADAYAMLSMLSGNTHEVYTGVTLLGKKNGREWQKTFFEKTEVVFYPLSEEEIEAYVSGKDFAEKEKAPSWYFAEIPSIWKDKAGGYGIQEPFGMCVIEEIRGDYNNVVGLPTGRLYQELKEWQDK